MLSTMVDAAVVQIRSLAAPERKFEAAAKLAEVNKIIQSVKTEFCLTCCVFCLQDIVHTGHYLLDEQRNAGWKDLGLVNQTRSANAILQSVEANGFLVAESLVSSRPFHSYRDNIGTSINIRDTNGLY